MIERLSGVIAARARLAVQVPQSLGGETVVAQLVAHLRTQGFRVLEIVARPELQALPLAAFGPLLASEPHPHDEPLAERVHRLYRVTAPTRDQTVLVIADAHHLDDTSAAVVHQLVRTSGVRALLTADAALPAALAELADRDHLLVDLADLTEPAEHDRLRFAAAADRPQRSDPATLTWAAQRAASQGDTGLAAALAREALNRAIVLAEPRPVAVLVTLADALSLGGQPEEADAVYADLLDVAEGDTLVAAVDNAAMHWAIRCHDPARAEAALRPVLARITDPARRTAMETSLAEAVFMAGVTAPTEPPTPSASKPPASPEDPIVTVRRMIFTVHQGMYAGRVSAARATAEQARLFARNHPSPGRPAAETIEFLWYLLLVVDARLDEAAAHAHAYRAEHPAYNGMWDYAVALPRFLAGDTVGAIRSARIAADRLAERDVVNAIGPAIGLYATAAASAGKPEVARAALASLPPNCRAGNVHTDLHASEAEAWMLAGQGDLDRAAATIVAAVRRGLDAEHTTFAALTAITAVRIGRPGTVRALLADAVRGCPDAALVPLLARYADAADEGDGAALVTVAGDLASAGLLGLAADAADSASAYGIPEGATLAATFRAGGAHPEFSPSAGLSRQEWAVVAAAADRLRNREIADRLGLSVRTVENYLANAFRKLGVTRRDALPERLRAAAEQRDGFDSDPGSAGR